MQQVNLYLPQFRPNREPVRSVHMLWGSAAFVILLLLMSFLSHRHNQTLNQQLVQSQQQVVELKQHLQQLIAAQPKANLEALDAQILQLQTNIAHRKQLEDLVATNNLGNSQGFSQQMAAMSRQALDTIALTAFTLVRGGSYAEFAGQARASDQIPLYLQKLRTEESFAHVAFGVLKVKPVAGDQNLLEIFLAKQNASDKPDNTKKTTVQKLMELNAQAAGGRDD